MMHVFMHGRQALSASKRHALSASKRHALSDRQPESCGHAWALELSEDRKCFDCQQSSGTIRQAVRASAVSAH